jgi:hypothetical protein
MISRPRRIGHRYAVHTYLLPDEYEKVIKFRDLFFEAGVIKTGSTAEFVRFCILRVIRDVEEAHKKRKASQSRSP